jgi:hypothetical protein
MESQATYMVRLSNGQEFGPAPMATIIEWAQQRRVPVDALLVPSDGSAARSVLSDEKLRGFIQAPPTAPTGPLQQPSSSAASVIIPTANPCALAGYYVAVFSIVAFPLAPVALVLGIIGLRARLKRPEVHGMAHAIVAIVVGFLISAAAFTVAALLVANA